MLHALAKRARMVILEAWLVSIENMVDDVIQLPTAFPPSRLYPKHLSRSHANSNKIVEN